MTMLDGLRQDLESVVRQLSYLQDKSDLAKVGVQVSKAKKLVKEAITLLTREKGKSSPSTGDQ